MKTIEVEVTEKHANEGTPGEADCCAIALAIHEQEFPGEEHMFAEVNADGTITILMDGEYEEETGSTPREELYTLYPDAKDEDAITLFIEDYDATGSVEDYGELSYMNFPYHFKFFRPTYE